MKKIINYIDNEGEPIVKRKISKYIDAEEKKVVENYYLFRGRPVYVANDGLWTINGPDYKIRLTKENSKELVSNSLEWLSKKVLSDQKELYSQLKNISNKFDILEQDKDFIISLDKKRN